MRIRTYIGLGIPESGMAPHTSSYYLRMDKAQVVKVLSDNSVVVREKGRQYLTLVEPEHIAAFEVDDERDESEQVRRLNRMLTEVDGNA